MKSDSDMGFSADTVFVTTDRLDVLVQEAKEEVAALTPVSTQTANAYRAIIRRTIAVRAAPRSRRTSQLYKSAWVWGLRMALARTLESDSAGDPDSLKIIGDQLKMLAAVRAVELPKSGKRSSKRQGLSKLPANWRGHLVAAAPNENLKALLELLSVTGIRPAELVAGVTATVSDGDVLLTIAGAKLTENTGQTWRSIRISSDSPEVANIVRLASGQPDRKLLLKAESTWLRRTVATLGKQCFPQLAYSISPYSFRHAIASDCKRTGVGRVEIARLLGHRTTRTQSCYGAAGLSKSGGIRDLNVSSSDAVKDNAFDPRRLHIADHDVPESAL